MGTKLLRYLIWLLVVVQGISAFAEGTKQLQPAEDKPCKIDILNPNATRFASYQAGPNEKLQIRIQNPQSEKIYLGFGIRFSGSETINGNIVPGTSNLSVYYRIKDPAGNIVAGPFLLNDFGPGFIASYAQAVAGPNVVDPAGYQPLEFQPAVAGDYSIEFNANSPTEFSNTNFKFDLFDITVVNTATQKAVPGRLWARTWDLSTLSFTNELFAKVYVYTPDGVVTSIDYNGMQPFGYTIVANSTGLTATGNGVNDRKSSNKKLLYPEYPIFLNDPDPTVYPSGSPSSFLSEPSLSGSAAGGFCIAVEVSKRTAVEVVIERNGQPGYQANSADVLLISNLAPGANCIYWNGKDGLGNSLAPGTEIQGEVQILSGLVNLPVYDVENHLNGYIVTLQRPLDGKPVKVYYDDTNTQVRDVQGNVLLTGDSNLDGCTDATGCHRWSRNFDFTNTATVADKTPLQGFGDEKTINTWWYTEEENKAFTVTMPVVPQIGLAKLADAPLLQPDGSYHVTYTIYAENLGNVALSNVQIEDNLTTAFPVPATFKIITAPVATGTLLANPAYNGTTDKNLLAAGSTLAIGAKQSVTFTISVKTSGFFGPFYNTAIGKGTGPDGQETTDTSTVGTNPDPNGNGNPNEPGENEPTPVTLVPNPVIGIAKAVSEPVKQQDGSYQVTYTFTVRNYGNTPLTNVQVTDNLAGTFAAPATFSLVAAPSATGTLAANNAFNGIDNTSLLISNQSSLAIGATETVSLVVNFKPNGASGPFLNTAIATATGPNNLPTTDVSTVGTNPDPNDNGKPDDANEDIPTPVVLPANAVIGVAKAVAEPVELANHTYDITYTLTVKNYGNGLMTNIQVTDDLLSTFPAPATYTLKGSVNATGTLSANAGFNGLTDKNLLVVENSSLAAGETATITFTVNVALNHTKQTVFNNTAIGAGIGPDSAETRDVSTVGTNPDPNNNSNPTEAGENDPTPVTLDPLVIPEGYSPNGDQSHDTFVIRGVSLLKVNIEIYNRWGSLVYQKNDYKNDWDGHSNVGLRVNDELPDGTYYYIIKLSDNRKFVGFLTLAR